MKAENIRYVQQQTGGHNYDVLIVDDSNSDYLILKKVADSRDEVENVIHAEDPFEAYNQLSDNSNIRVMVLDYEMSFVNGSQLLAKLTQSNIADYLYIIAFTADEDHATELLSLGADHYILKPIQHGTIGQALDEAKRIILD